MFKEGQYIYLCSASQFGKKITGGRIKKATKKTITIDLDINTKTIKIKDFDKIVSGLTYGSFKKYARTLEDADKAATACADQSADYFHKQKTNADKNMMMSINVRNSAPTIRPFKE